MGSVLQPAGYLEARALREVAQGAAGVRADFEAVSPDVRQHRHCDRQRQTRARESDGAFAGAALPAVVRLRTRTSVGLLKPTERPFRRSGISDTSRTAA